MAVSDYAHPALVDADWARAHLEDPAVRFVEVDVDTAAYDQSHIPGALGWNWTSQLADGIRRDIASREEFSDLLSRSGIGPDTTVVLYGDNNNWFAAWAFWLFSYYGHEDVRLMNGGGAQWGAEGRALKIEAPSDAETTESAEGADEERRGRAVRRSLAEAQWRRRSDVITSDERNSAGKTDD